MKKILINHMGSQSCKTQCTLKTLFEKKQVSVQFCYLLTTQEREVWLQHLKSEEEPKYQFEQHFKNQKHPSFVQIQKDIARTFPHHQFFHRIKNVIRFQLLLKKFALFFPKIGYTQGLNFIAGYLLLAGFSDHQAFQLLVWMILHHKILLIGIYQDGFPLNQLYCALFWKMIDKKLPTTSSKIKESKLMNQSWIFQWFMSFFLYSFPVEFVKTFIQYIIYKKQFSIVLLAIGIIYCLKKKIKEMNDPDQFDLFDLFNNFKDLNYCHNNIHIDTVIKYANSFTKRDIQEALQSTNLKNNIYYTYFTQEEKQKKGMWKNMLIKIDKERKMFHQNPLSSAYQRDRKSVQHLQRFLMKQSRMYRPISDQHFSSQIRVSNFTVDVQQQQKKNN